MIFLQWLKLATSNLAHSLGLPRPIIKSQQEEKWAWPWARRSPYFWGFPFNISATVEASDFKTGMQLWGLPRPIVKITLRRKVGVALG